MIETARIHRWSTPGLGSVNTFWIEGPAGVVVIDGQRELSKARQVRARSTRPASPSSR